MTGKRIAVPPWHEAHFIGGHPALDLANTTANRKEPTANKELLKSPSDISAWCQSVGLISAVQARGLIAYGGEELVDVVRHVRSYIWAVFDATSEGQAPPPKSMGGLLRLAGLGASAEIIAFRNAQMKTLTGNLAEPETIPPALALLALEALFILPKDRVRACPRCGRFFIDRSKGGHRRWCSMQVCGNKEKAARHRYNNQAGAERIRGERNRIIRLYRFQG